MVAGHRQRNAYAILSRTSSASGMGNDTAVEPSPVAGRNVLDIRDDYPTNL